jgi:transcriptional antiterminator NusG
MSIENSHKWYVVRCFSSHEKKVKDYLEDQIKEHGLGEKIKEVLIPTETVVVIKGGKKKTQERNFFPGYILLNAIYDSEVNDLLQDTPSCMGFLREQERKEPTPLKDAEVNQILSRVRDNEDQAQKGGVIDIPFKEGELVKVIEGPFKEFDGTVQEINHDKLKLRVLVSIFGRKTPVEVDINQVEKMI